VRHLGKLDTTVCEFDSSFVDRGCSSGCTWRIRLSVRSFWRNDTLAITWRLVRAMPSLKRLRGSNVRTIPQ
jgi:hypothetical protein